MTESATLEQTIVSMAQNARIASFSLMSLSSERKNAVLRRMAGLLQSEKSYIQDVRRGVISIEFSHNFGVIKTRSGHANSVALALDVLGLPEILGTLAGDDTIFVLLREGMTKEDLLESFKLRIPEIEA